MHIDEQQDWMDGFEAWEEVWACLTDDWTQVVDVRQRLEVEREVDDLLVVEVDRGLRARQRRELHRLGFRPRTSVRVTLWHWEVGAVDTSDVQHPLRSLYDGVDPAARPRPYELLRIRMATEELIRQQMQRVLQDVFRSSPADVVVVVHRERDEWEDEEGQWSTG